MARGNPHQRPRALRMFQVVRPLSPDAWLPDRDPFRAGGHGLCLVAHGSSVGWARAIAILLSVAVTVFASLQTFLRYSERAEKHRSEEHTSELQSLRHLVC